MAKFRRYVAAATGLSILAVAVSLFSGQQAQGANPAHVVITNTSAQPVPMLAQGTTAITGNVGITGTPTVNLAGGSNVGIAGTPAVDLAPGATVGINPASNTVQIGNALAAPVPTMSISATKHWGFGVGLGESTNTTQVAPEPIDASLITVNVQRGNVYLEIQMSPGAGCVGCGGIFRFTYPTAGQVIVLPLPQPVTVDRVFVVCSSPSPTGCFAEWVIVGR